MTEQEAARFKRALNSRNYYWRHREACLERIRAYRAAHRDKWLGPDGYNAKYRARRKSATEIQP